MKSSTTRSPEESYILDFEKAEPIYRAFTSSLVYLIEKLLSEIEASVFTIEGRTKTKSSFEEKVGRSGKYYADPLKEMTDISGIRIITYQLEGVDKVSKILSSNFKVDTKNSIDKGLSLEEDRFGYLSKHIVVSLKSDRSLLPEYESYKGLKAEIQIRTILQHTWAVIHHKLIYKNPDEVPKELRRKFNRLSALLEVADSEFQNFQGELAAIQRNYGEQVQKNDLDLHIDIDSLTAYIEGSEIPRNLLKAVEHKDLNVILRHPDSKRREFSSLLSDKSLHTMSKISQLDKSLKSIKADCPRFISEVLRHWRNKVGVSPSKLVLNRETLLRIIFLLFQKKGKKENSRVDLPSFGKVLQESVKEALDNFIL